VSGDLEQLRPARIEEVAALVVEAARGLSERLGAGRSAALAQRLPTIQELVPVARPEAGVLDLGEGEPRRPLYASAGSARPAARRARRCAGPRRSAHRRARPRGRAAPRRLRARPGGGAGEQCGIDAARRRLGHERPPSNLWRRSSAWGAPDGSTLFRLPPRSIAPMRDLPPSSRRPALGAGVRLGPARDWRPPNERSPGGSPPARPDDCRGARAPRPAGDRLQPEPRAGAAGHGAGADRDVQPLPHRGPTARAANSGASVSSPAARALAARFARAYLSYLPTDDALAPRGGCGRW